MFNNELLIDLSAAEQELLSGGQLGQTPGGGGQLGQTPGGGGQSTPTSGSPTGGSQQQEDQFTFVPLIVLLPVATIDGLANSRQFKK
jgi:hypothetical protein